MAIQQLNVHGFRSLKSASWKPGTLNLLVGPNGAGKSNLLRLLEFIASTAKGRLAETVRQAGGMVPLLWDHASTSLGWKVRLDPPERGRDRVREAVTYEVTLQQLGSGSSYEISYDVLTKAFEAEAGTKPNPFKFFEQDPRHKVVFDPKQRRLVLPPEEINENESLLSQVADPLSYRVITAVRRSIEAWRIHHDVHVERGSAMRSPATTQHAKLVAADGSNLTTVLHTLYTGERETRLAIDEGMRAAFGQEYEELVFQPAAAQQIQLAVQWRSSRQPHVGEDLSDGTLRFLFLLTVLASPDAAPLIAIDEPETGLHPSMLPIVAEYAGVAAKKTQIFLTSHSPEFLDAFTALAPQVTVCHWEQGETRLYTLGPERLKNWLDKYRLGRLFTSGELEVLIEPDVEMRGEFGERIKSLPSEDEALARLPVQNEPKKRE